MYKPTRFNVSGSGNILDLILCNDPLFVNVNDITEPFSTSDHCVINFSILVNDFNPPSVDNLSIHDDAIHDDSSHDSISLPVLDWSKANYVEINNALSSVDCHLVVGYSFDVESIWHGFKDIIWPIITSFVPNVLIKHNVKYKPRQYPKYIRFLLTRKAAIWRKLKSVCSNDLFVKYRDIAQACKTVILEFDIERERKIL